MTLTDHEQVSGAAAHRRTRPSHALRNDALIPEAAIRVIATVGWDEFSLSKVAEDLDLAKTAVYNRYRSRVELAVDVWRDRLFAVLTDALDAVVQAIPASADSHEPRTAAMDDADARAAFHAAMTRFAYPDAAITSGVELLLGSLVDPELFVPVREPAEAWLRSRFRGLHGSATPVDRVHDARTVAVLTWAFGLTIFATRPWVQDMDLSAAFDRAHVALTHDTPIRELPPDRATHLTSAPFHTGDPRTDAALDHALSSVGSIGYQRTRILDIARAADVSEAFVLLRFKTKLGLMQAMVDMIYAESYQALTDFQEHLTDAYGPGIAEATAWREYLNPAIRDRQMLGVETDRLIRFRSTMSERAFADELAIVHARLAAVPRGQQPLRLGDTHLDFATGHGLPILGLLVPDAWTLPYNVVTEPYTGNDPFTHAPAGSERDREGLPAD